jgi:hypothetical protein
MYTQKLRDGRLWLRKMENGFTVGFTITPAKLQFMRIRHVCVENNFTSKADTCSADRTCRNLNNKIHCHVRSLHTALLVYRLHYNSSFSEVFVSKHIVADATTPQI